VPEHFCGNLRQAPTLTACLMFSFLAERPGIWTVPSGSGGRGREERIKRGEQMRKVVPPSEESARGAQQFVPAIPNANIEPPKQVLPPGFFKREPPGDHPAVCRAAQ